MIILYVSNKILHMDFIQFTRQAVLELTRKLMCSELKKKNKTKKPQQFYRITLETQYRPDMQKVGSPVLLLKAFSSRYPYIYRVSTN